MTYSYNVWTQRTCGSTDRQASNASSFFHNPGAHDWRLKAGSPAIDRGNPTDYPATDRAGTTRNGLPDAGALRVRRRDVQPDSDTDTHADPDANADADPDADANPDADADADPDASASLGHAGPVRPQGMAWTATTKTSIGVRWNASSDNVGVTGYRIYRNGTRVGDRRPARPTRVTGLTCGTSYTIGLTAIDAAGNESNRAQATGTTSTAACDPAPPLPPTPTVPPGLPEVPVIGGIATITVQPPTIISATLSSPKVCVRKTAQCKLRTATLRLVISKDAQVDVQIRHAGGARRLASRIRGRSVGGVRNVAIKGSRLAPGRYRITSVATDDAGRTSAAVQRMITVRR